MSFTLSKILAIPSNLSVHQTGRLAAAGLLTFSLILALGIAPANAAPQPSPAPSETSAAATETSAPSDAPAPSTTSTIAEPESTPTAAEASEFSSPAADTPAVTPQPAAEKATVQGETTSEEAPATDGPGAFMGQGLVKQQLGLAANEPLTADDLNAKLLRSKATTAFSTPADVPGLDVSGWQASYPAYAVSSVDWAKQWSLGARFLYAKATEGSTFIDASRSSHLKGADAAGITLHGAYHFALPDQSSAVSQADFFVKNGGTWTADGTTLPPLLDIENNPYGSSCYGLSPSAMVTWITAFSNRVLTLTGRLPMIYTNYYWWQECTGGSTAFASQPLHIAAYGAASPWLPGGWSKWSFWQFSDSAPFAGDSNVWNGTLTSLKTFASKADSQVPVSTGPSIPSPADVVAADSSGALWNYPATGSGSIGTRKQIGQGWTGMRSIQVIDWNSDGILDLIAQSTSGSLKVYLGKATGGFVPPATLAASGWAGYQLTIGYWLNSSKYPQILTRDSAGAVRVWANNSGGPLGSATSIGQGWQGINMTMLDFDGDGRQDILGQFPDGILKLYRSDGSGSFINELRKTIGTGWNAYTSVTVYSDFTSRGSMGLIRRNSSGVLSYLPVSGNSSFGSPAIFGSGWTSYLIAGGDNINLGGIPSVPTVSKPTAPPAPKAVAGVASITVTVAAPTQGSAATSQKVTSKPGSVSCTIAKAAGSCTLTGLTNGTTYTVSTVAMNSAGSSPASSPSNSVVPFAAVSRISGADRYATSAAISKASYATGISTVYIASGIDYPDALSGAAAAGNLNAPVLLATTTGLPAATRTELTRLQPKKIIILGGTGALNNTVQNQLAQYSSTVTRIAGSDRYTTSAAISKASYATGISTVYIASGIDYPDALSGAAAAGKLNAPVLLATTTGLPAATRTELTRLQPKKIIILGGTGALNNTVQNQLAQYSSTVTRIAGTDRYATSAAISKASYATGISTVYIASGIDYPDTLSGAAAAGKLTAPVLLATTTGLPAATRTELTRLKPKRIIILGGTGALNNTVQNQIGQYVP